ncbi:hypothetical protein [Mycobacterium dioxanotrophicus]|uniref:hypothetical protein n=1 Tax=Mycobacterium dioxanotrophicus TaxID=482462 RepID=UPI0012FB987C|nr:hypothetical protein [Mycobacterium dioxanotrophicus]
MQEFDRSTLLDIWLDGFTSGLTTAAQNLSGCGGDMADKFADDVVIGIKKDPAAMETIRREVFERVTGMFDANEATRELTVNIEEGGPA